MGLEDGKVKERLFIKDPSTLNSLKATGIAQQTIITSQLFAT